MLSACTINDGPQKLTYQNIRNSDFYYEMSFEEALKKNNGAGFISPDYWPNDGSIYFDKRSVASHQVGVVNQHTRYLNGNDMSEVSTELFNSMEYWLIRETKRKLIDRFLKNSGKSTNQHKFKPHLLGGKEGYGSIFLIEDGNEESIENFYVFLRKVANIPEKNVDFFVESCFPHSAYFDMKITKRKPLKYYSEQECEKYLRLKKTPFWGMRVIDLEKTRVVETFIEEKPKFDTGFYHHLFNTPVSETGIKTDNQFFTSLLSPQENRFTIHISKDTNYILDKELAVVKDARHPTQFHNETFVSTISDSLFDKDGIANLYGDVVMGRRGNSLDFNKEPGRIFHRLFEKCGFDGRKLPIAFEKFSRLSYKCQSGGFKRPGWEKSKYNMKLKQKSDVSILALNDDRLIRSSYRKSSKHHGAFITLNNFVDHEGKSKDELAQELIKKQYYYSFLSWVNIEGDQIYGNVEYYGMLFKYNITDIVKWMLKEHLKNADNKMVWELDIVSKDKQALLALFPELMSTLN
jgi:hypothetical protein